MVEEKEFRHGSVQNSDEKIPEVTVNESDISKLMEKNEAAIPTKHVFYRRCAQRFFEQGQIKGISGFNGIYPTSFRLVKDKIYALMLDWFWSVRTKTNGNPTSKGEMRGFHGYLGAGLSSKGLSWEQFGLAQST